MWRLGSLRSPDYVLRASLMELYRSDSIAHVYMVHELVYEAKDIELHVAMQAGRMVGYRVLRGRPWIIARAKGWLRRRLGEGLVWCVNLSGRPSTSLTLALLPRSTP